MSETIEKMVNVNNTVNNTTNNILNFFPAEFKGTFKWEKENKTYNVFTAKSQS